MKKIILHILSRLPFYSLFFIFPVLGMANCEGWNEGSGTVNSCIADVGLLRAYADFYFMFVTISSFMFMLPVLLYIVVGIKLAESFAKKLRRNIAT